MDDAVICIQGPTASGKSELAERLALRLDGEIVSADSMQVYIGMDIGTAKTPPTRRRVPYHCIDLLQPGEPYSAALYQRDARAAIEDIRSRGKRAIVCGGTGLYVRAALDDMSFAAGQQQDNDVRMRYERLLAEQGAACLHAELERRDPASAALIHPNNTRRVVRALEMLDRGESYAERKQRFKSVPAYYRSVRIALDVSRPVLYQRIDERVDAMFDAGLIEEVERLLACGFREGLTASQAIGYKEVVAALDGTCTLEEAREQIQRSTRRYAKRQLTWLRSDASIRWLAADGGVDDALVAAACDHIAQAHERGNGKG